MFDTPVQTAIPISEYAIIVNEIDNVAVVKSETHMGLVLELPNGDQVELRAAVPLGHRFAIREIAKDEFVRQYGQPIGTSMGIGRGKWINHENMSDHVPVVRDLSEDLHNPAPDHFEPQAIVTFKGFRRANGRVGAPETMC